MKLPNRRILITGAASGIGKATAELFAREGAQVALLDRDGDAVSTVAASMSDARAHVCDVTDHDAVGKAVAAAARAMGGIDGVVNAAGIDLIRDFATMTPAEWHRVFAVNVTGTMSVCHAALDALSANATASIVNLASGAGLFPIASRTAYCASKAAVVMFSKALAVDLAPSNIRVNVVCPGAIETPMLRSGIDAAEDPPGMQEAVRNRVVLKRIGQPADIAAAILFLTGADSTFATGSTLVVDGGRVFH
ncbi:MAG: SDR family oxidoreductase [Proteobacteria bacterium]|nr:SDR family oxidoreductase [Pseudomonadota bacterium]